MARTKASAGAKLASGKSSKARCAAPPSTSAAASSTSSERSSRYGGGNPVCPRETPKWQKPITNFFISKQTNGTESEDVVQKASSSSKPRPETKRNIINSDNETSNEEDLDESLPLPAPTGENCHKIEEYYKKGKGEGKKTKEKETVVSNEDKPSKRERQHDEESEDNVSKKFKEN